MSTKLEDKVVDSLHSDTCYVSGSILCARDSRVNNFTKALSCGLERRQSETSESVKNNNRTRASVGY
jgi:hypothetical protein